MSDVTNTPQSEYLTRAEAAAFLGLTVNWLENSGRAAGVPYYRFAGSVRYSRTELADWAKAQKVA